MFGNGYFGAYFGDGYYGPGGAAAAIATTTSGSMPFPVSRTRPDAYPPQRPRWRERWPALSRVVDAVLPRPQMVPDNAKQRDTEIVAALLLLLRGRV